MKRRNFLAAVAAIPFVGRFVPAPGPTPKPIKSPAATKPATTWVVSWRIDEGGVLDFPDMSVVKKSTAEYKTGKARSVLEIINELT